jgi:hypothetical protein
MVVRSTERLGCVRTTRRYDSENRILHRREDPQTEIYHNVFVYYDQSLRLDGGVTEDICGVGNTPSLQTQPAKSRIRVSSEPQRRYTALPRKPEIFCGSSAALLQAESDCHCSVACCLLQYCKCQPRSSVFSVRVELRI